MVDTRVAGHSRAAGGREITFVSEVAGRWARTVFDHSARTREPAGTTLNGLRQLCGRSPWCGLNSNVEKLVAY